jgi:hypothetical protein
MKNTKSEGLLDGEVGEPDVRFDIGGAINDSDEAGIGGDETNRKLVSRVSFRTDKGTDGHELVVRKSALKRAEGQEVEELNEEEA